MFKKITVSNEVKIALANNEPVVALESTIISHGMPYPQNVQTARLVEKEVRDIGATPATIAILDGMIYVGLDDELLDRLGSLGSHCVTKCSRRNIASVVAAKKHGSTTVAATMIIANLCKISVFVTGGIGGVHRGAESTMDISADLVELSKTPVAVVSAGVKSILDIGRTLEVLETNGVPVVTIGSDRFPAFFTPDSGFQSPIRIDTHTECADLILMQEELGIRTGILFTVPISAEEAASTEHIATATNQAIVEANKQGITGAEITPFLLKRVNELTNGESLTSNIALIRNNARHGARLSIALSNARKSSLKST